MQCVSLQVVVHDGVAHKVPCGRCGFCLSNKRSQWMFRIFHEMKNQEYPGYFLTLTYDERHVRRVADGRLSLRFRDVQLFIKKLRKAGYYVKYVCVGEYGGQTARPHYHMLLWTDCPCVSFSEFWTSHQGKEVLGSIHVGRVSMRSAMYCLKYIINPKPFHDVKSHMEKPRAQFSKGIGLSYLSSAVYEYHTFDYDSPVLSSVIDGRTVALPRYYCYKIFTKYQRRWERCKLITRAMKEETKLFRSLRAKGIKGIRPYVKALRVEQARRIVKKSKLNQYV